jgi:hypothetical protein
MKNYIEHSEFVNLYNKDNKIFDRLFKDVNLFNSFINRMKKESKNYKKYSYTDEQGAEKMNGDIFEIFGEPFFKILGADNRIGVYNYKPEQDGDCGVDASGLGIDNKPLTIQNKFRSDVTTLLTEKDLHQFAFQSVKRFKVDPNTTTNMIVFTSADGLHWFTNDKVFLNTIRTIGINQIRSLVDNNYCFWNMVRDMIEETIRVKY